MSSAIWIASCENRGFTAASLFSLRLRSPSTSVCSAGDDGPKGKRSVIRLLIKTLSVPLDANFSRIAARDENEIDTREHEPYRPPNGSEEQSARARSNGVGGQ